MPGMIDVSGFLPTTVATQVTQEVTQTSLALQLARTMPIPAGVSVVPVPASFPRAAWISTGQRKPFTDFSFAPVSLQAEEVAAIIAIPDAMIEDSAIDLWGFARPRLAEAIADAIDLAILWGIDAPATFPVGGVAAVAADAGTGTDVVETVNLAMSAVEQQGLPVTGSAADLSVRGALRGVRDANGALLLGPAQVAGANAGDTLYGTPIQYGPWSIEAGLEDDFITGDWRQLVIGVRSDIRYTMDSSGVVTDDEGVVRISAFQDNATLMKVWARYGAVIMQPVTRRTPEGAVPFAKASLGGGIPEGTVPGNIKKFTRNPLKDGVFDGNGEEDETP